MSIAFEALPAQVIASRYRVMRELGRGGMGVVYVAEHVHTGEQVALKILLGDSAKDPKAVERFKREARASSRIRSENVVRVIDADVAPELDGAPFLVMELLNGSDLERRMLHGGRLSADEVMLYLGQAAVALDKSHAVGIVHRDLKPENLFLHTRDDGSTILKILDFGISKAVGGDKGNDIVGASATKTGAIMGTPLYMAPEQARGWVNEIGPATDVWAMGLIALQLLTGEIYWRANTVAELMVQILADPFYPTHERWPWLPPSVDAWFQRSCARAPLARFRTVGEQIAALGAALRNVPVASALESGATVGRTSSMGAASGAPAAQAVTSPFVRTTTGAISREEGAVASSSRHTGAVLTFAAMAVAVVAGAAMLLRGQSHANPLATAGAAIAIEPNASSATEQPPTANSATAGSASAPAPTASAQVATVPPLASAVGGAAHVRPTLAPLTSAAPPHIKAHGAPSPASVAPGASAEASARPAKGRPDCTVPFIVDAEGHRQYRPECF